MNVGDYFYYMTYLGNLTIYYDQNVKKMSIKNRMGICIEIENIKKKLEESW